MEIFWLGHASFKIKTDDGKIIYLDPYQIPKEEEKADIIISSHEHGDHFDKKSIKNLVKENSLVIGPESISDNLQKFNGKGLALNEPFEIVGIKIELVPAYNIKRMRPGTNEPFHPKEKGWAGTVLEIEGKKIYHAGDTEHIPEMKELTPKKIDVALLPCGGTYTMDFEESCDVAAEIKPKIVIPMHNWDKSLEEYANTLAKKDASIEVKVLENESLKI